MKTLGIAEFKAGLCKHLRTVRRGGELVIADHGHPVARVVPYGPNEPDPPFVQRARGSLADWRPTHGVKVKTDIVALLLEDRQR